MDAPVSDVYLAIDPAMAKTGLAMWREGEDLISTVLVKPASKSEKNDFRSVYGAARDIAAQVSVVARQLVYSEDTERVCVALEHPPPTGMWAAGLSIVDSIVLNRLHQLQVSPYLIHPTRINTLLTSAEDPTLAKKLQRKTSFTKKERREYLYEIMSANGLAFKLKPNQRPNKKVSYDEADAGLILLYMIHNLHGPLKLPEDFVSERWLLKEMPCPA